MPEKVRTTGWGCEGYWNSHVYRTFRINRLIELFESGENVLVRPSMWEDPYDNWVIGLFDHLGYSPEDKRPVFGQCWSLSLNEEIHWKLYAPQRDGVIVRSTTNVLRQAAEVIDDGYVTIGKLQYWTQAQIQNLIRSHVLSKQTGATQVGGFVLCRDAIARVMERKPELCEDHLLKRLEFAFEDEVRLLYAPFRGTDRCTFGFPIDPVRMVDQIVFDPRMSPGLVSVYRSYFKSKGFNGIMRQSSLYDIPISPAAVAKKKALKPPVPISEKAWRVTPRKPKPKTMADLPVVERIDLPHLGQLVLLDHNGHLTLSGEKWGLSPTALRESLETETVESIRQNHRHFTDDQFTELLDLVKSKDWADSVPEEDDY